MTRLLAGLTGLATLIFAIGAVSSPVPIYLPVAGAAVTAVLLLSAHIPLVMRFLVALFALSFLVLGAITALNAAGLVPDALLPFLPPPHAALVAAILALVNYGICHVRVVRQIIDLAGPYFEAEEVNSLELGWLGTWRLSERRIGLGLLGVIVVLNVVQVYLSVLFNYNNNAIFTALQDKDAAGFAAAIIAFSIIATFGVSRSLLEYYLTQILQIHWRRWLTNHYITQWLGSKTHYRLALGAEQTDNPDQRIAEDVADFVINTIGFYLQIFVTSLSLYAFVQILWSISAQFPYRLGSFELSQLPGYLVWISLTLALLATLITHIIGQPLVGLNFRKQRVEADFRFNLVRVRENGEEIALLNGESVESTGLMRRFAAVFRNTLDVAVRQVKLTCWTLSFKQAMNVLPFVILAPAYFTNAAMKLGSLTQASQAFGEVMGSFIFFVDFYSSLASYRAILNRLLGFDAAIAKTEATRTAGIHIAATSPAGIVSAPSLDVALPDGRLLLKGASLMLRRGERTLVTGPSGSGKTTLFRALAGVWPFGRGTVAVPQGERVMTLPQRPYLPLGTLRAALAYPLAEATYPDDAVRAALARVDLADLAGRLDDMENWTNALSGGEKQRVAIVRALLARPDWLLLDEATSALDEAAEAAVYGALREALPETTIVSIGHRASLAKLHDRRIALEPSAEGTRLVDAPMDAFAAGG